MSVKSRTDIQNQINTDFADNTTGNITAELLRTTLSDISDTMVNSLTDTASTGFAEYNTSRVYYQYNYVIYSYKIYRANTTTVAGAFDSSKWDFVGYVEFTGSLTIATADVLQLNTTPKVLISAITGRTIRVKNIRAKMTYAGVAYATNTTLNVYMTVGGASNSQFTIPTFLAATADEHRIGTVTAAAKLAASADVKISVNTGNPTAGTSDIVIYYDYDVLD